VVRVGDDTDVFVEHYERDFEQFGGGGARNEALFYWGGIFVCGHLVFAKVRWDFGVGIWDFGVHGDCECFEFDAYKKIGGGGDDKNNRLPNCRVFGGDGTLCPTWLFFVWGVDTLF